MLIPKMSLADWLTEASRPPRRSLTVLVGESGVGKSWLSDQVAQAMGVPWLNLDSFGHQETISIDGKQRTRWIVKIPALKAYLFDHPKIVFVSGTCDNLSHVVSALARDYALTFYIAVADAELFRTIQLRKAQKGAEDGLPQEWINGWVTKSKLQDDQIWELYDRSSWGYICALAYGLAEADELDDFEFTRHLDIRVKFKEWAKFYWPQRENIVHALRAACCGISYVVNTKDSPLKIVHGWHKSKFEAKVLNP